MGLHWVEQAALEAQAEIAAAAAANEKAKAAEESSRRRRRSSSSSSSRHGKKRRRGERPAAEAASFSAVCDRRWSHSDELDQLVQLIRQPRSAAAEESYRSEMRRQVYAELQSIRLRLTQASGWEALSAVPMAPRDSQWRRCAHEVASSLGLATASEGDGAERHVVVSRPAYGTAAAPLSSSDGAENGHGGQWRLRARECVRAWVREFVGLVGLGGSRRREADRTTAIGPPAATGWLRCGKQHRLVGQALPHRGCGGGVGSSSRAMCARMLQPNEHTRHDLRVRKGSILDPRIERLAQQHSLCPLTLVWFC